MTHNWSHTRTSTASGRMLVSDANGYTHETNHFLVGSSIPNASADVRGYHHDFISSRNPVVPQSFHSASAHSARGIRSSYSQRPSPTFRASSSSLRLGHMAPSDDGMPLVAENFSSRQPRLLSTAAWRNSDRNGRSRNSYERYRSLPNEPSLHDRFSSEGFMVVDRSAFYGSRNLFDQHRDMRLDIDNKSYEELLALGERIGSVSTGFDEDLISKCLTETVYGSSGQSEDEGTCAICLVRIFSKYILSVGF
ncbi:probable E3 ubiquitin-protein ligase HIP1 isoform X2 [Manihot esculenta]|nr:probable E3 ubiquitin-protein ligase HIP1 isoform X2 [Manihot esculenta]